MKINADIYNRHHKNSQKSSSFRYAAYAAFPFFFLPPIYAKSKPDEEDDDKSKDSSMNLRDKFNFIADVVELVLPAIVQIDMKLERRDWDIFTGKGDLNVSSGSGFIVSDQGIIITNAHVVRNVNRDVAIWVKLNDGRCVRARLLKIDYTMDLAILKIECVHNKYKKKLLAS